jgi:hypothetical protein
MDLGMLEKKLAEKYQHQHPRQGSQGVSHPTSPSQATSGHDGSTSTPRSSITSPEPSHKDKESDHERRKSFPPEEKKRDEEEVAALSEMMCSLVTNNSGETRYIGMYHCRLLMF